MRRRTTEPLWLSRTVVDAMHTDQIREHGGLLGLRDKNALESALARPRQKWNYEPETDLASLGAAYAFGFARNHPYNDGNKRIALLAMVTFASINGYDVEADDDDILTTMLGLASGRITEADLAAWLRSRLASAR
jgi:death-on-curing protein